MGDLISRSALIKALSEKYSGLSDAREETDFAMYTAFKQIVRIISNQQTDYDVEKVIEEIKKSEICPKCLNNHNDISYCATFCDTGKKLLFVRNGGKE